MKKTPWIVSALLVVGIITTVINVSSQLHHEQYDTEWIVQAEDLAIRAATEEEIPEDASYNSEHYILTGKIHNNSRRDLAISIYVDVRPEKGDQRAARVDQSAAVAAVNVRDAVPIGCTGNFELPVVVWPEKMKSDKLVLVIEPYGQQPVEIGTVAMPD